MKQIVRLCSIALVVAQLGLVASARAAGNSRQSSSMDPCLGCPTCEPPAAPGDVQDYVIDASAPVPGPGSVTFGKIGNRRGFALSKKVRVVVVNENPFAFKYRLIVEEKVVEETAIAEFFKRLGPFNPLKTEEKTDAMETDKETKDKKTNILNMINSGGGAPPDACTLEANEIVDMAIQLSTDAECLETRVNWLIELQLGARRTYETGLPLLLEGTDCARLRNVAGDIRAKLQTLEDALNGTPHDYPLCPSASGGGAAKTDPPRILIRRLEADANDINARGIALKRKIQSFQVFCVTQSGSLLTGRDLVKYTKIAEGASAVATDHLENLAGVAEGQAVLDTALVGLKKVLGDENAFYDIANIGDYDSSTDVAVKLERKAVNDEKAEFAQLHAVEFNFGGGQRFALSGGIVGSPLGKEEFASVQGIVFNADGTPQVDADGNPVLGVFVGRKEGSSSRLLPMVFLHGRILDFDSKIVNALHLSAGVTASSDDEGTDPEFLFGPSLSFINNNLFLTAGGYVGRIQQLEGNLFLGAPIPADLGEIPVRKDYKWHVGFAISWKFPTK